MRRPTIALAIGALVVATGLAAGIDPLSDNSLFTHLATARLIFDGHGLPHSDPYTFTAAGEPWVVQSWFASLLYGLADKAGGLVVVRVLMASTAATLAGLGWRLTRPAGPVVGRLAAVVPFLVVGFDGWGQRPLLLGLVFFGLALLAAEGGLDPRWLVPAGWLWLNTHGSWPLGLVAVACLALGRRLDDGDRPTVELRAGLWLAAGFGLGMLNPYGPKLLTFPVTLLRRRESLRGIVEWQPPRFDNISQYGFLLLLVVAIVALRRRPSWRAAIPLALFTVAALIGARNVQTASLVLLPGMAAGLAGLGSVDGEERTPASTGIAVVAAALAAITLTAGLADPSVRTTAYPVAAVRYLQEHDLDPTKVRVVTHDYVGNYLELLVGADAQVFIDDRAELTPVQVSDDYRTLLRGGEGWEEALDRYDPDVVLWEIDEALTQLIELDEGWREVYRDRRYAAFVPAAP